MPGDPVPARPASTVLVVRQLSGLEVLLVKRPDRAAEGADGSTVFEPISREGALQVRYRGVE